MVILPLLFFIFVTIIFSLRKPGMIRENILKAFLVTFSLIGFSTEILSLFNKITFTWISSTWLVLVLLSLILFFLTWINFKKGRVKQTPPLSEIKEPVSKGMIGTCLVILILISSITLFIALKSPPNNFDSMTYHMARIPHWIQNQSIRYYPTAIPRQNYSMPLAEFGILHLQLLSKSDHFANLVQWFSFILSILTTALIAKQIKVSPRGQWITAVLTAALPMAILQSTSTQNDLVVGIFCLSMAYFLDKGVKDKNWEDILFAGISMGLALATKGTAYIFCAGIGIGIGGISLLGKKWTQIKELSLRYGIVIVIALILNSGIYLRNWNLYRHPLITSNERTLVDKISPVILFSNLTRNSAVQLGTPIQATNDFLEQMISSVLGPELHNPESTFQDARFGISFSINEDETGNVVHFVLLTLALLILPWIKAENKIQRNSYLLAVGLMIIFYSLAFKWQPWGGRLQTPIFILGCVFTGLLFDRFIKIRILPELILVFFLISTSPYLLLNTNRPLLPIWEDEAAFKQSIVGRSKIFSNLNGKLENYPALAEKYTSFISLLYEGRSVVLSDRRELYFLGNFEPFYWYMEAGHYLRNDPSREIGLLMDSNDWEYPFWVLLRQHASQGDWRINHILVEDISGDISLDLPSRPKLIVVTRDNYQDLPLLTAYEQVYSSSSIKIMKLIE